MSLTVLIVDDEENFRLNISSFLTGRGYEVLEAATLQEARDSATITGVVTSAQNGQRACPDSEQQPGRQEGDHREGPETA